jgi:hypothetical protein
VALSVSCQSLSNGSGKQTTKKNPNLSTARLIVDFINSIGHKRTLSGISAMSALPPKADIDPSASDVRFVP